MTDRGVLVVTGGGRGIGAATARLAAERGYGVVVNYAANAEAAEALCAAIHKAGGVAMAVRGDVAEPEDVEHIFRAADRMGRLSGLVNNAGMIASETRVELMDAARINRVLAVNVTGTLLCAAAAIRRMSIRHGGQGGAIVNLSSASAKLGAPARSVDYAASKGGVDSLTIGLAQEVGPEGIRVNAIRPGLIATDMLLKSDDPERGPRIAPTLPIPRMGAPEEVARAILWLLSDEASYVTGAVLPVSGGRAILP